MNHFDILLVRLVDDEGRVGYGESCPVPPYSKESAELVWETILATLPSLVGVDARDALARLVRRAEGAESFSYVAPTTAVESLVDPIQREEQFAVPIVGTVLSHRLGELAEEVEALSRAGYRTLKVKVGFDPREDARRLAEIQAVVPAATRLRLDANEAWTPTQAREFLDLIDPSGIELLEQPFPRQRWDWTADLSRDGKPVSLMLDESIAGEESIEKAAEVGADIVKLKLMKCGSRHTLSHRMEFATGLDLGVVVGNGIAGIVDNWYESFCIRNADRDGEMNGSLKLKREIFTQRPYLDDGKLQFPKGFHPDVDTARLEAFSLRTATC